MDHTPSTCDKSLIQSEMDSDTRNKLSISHLDMDTSVNAEDCDLFLKMKDQDSETFNVEVENSVSKAHVQHKPFVATEDPSDMVKSELAKIDESSSGFSSTEISKSTLDLVDNTVLDLGSEKISNLMSIDEMDKDTKGVDTIRESPDLDEILLCESKACDLDFSDAIVEQGCEINCEVSAKCLFSRDLEPVLSIKDGCNNKAVETKLEPIPKGLKKVNNVKRDNIPVNSDIRTQESLIKNSIIDRDKIVGDESSKVDVNFSMSKHSSKGNDLGMKLNSFYSKPCNHLNTDNVNSSKVQSFSNVGFETHQKGKMYAAKDLLALEQEVKLNDEVLRSIELKYHEEDSSSSIEASTQTDHYIGDVVLANSQHFPNINKDGASTENKKNDYFDHEQKNEMTCGKMSSADILVRLKKLSDDCKADMSSQWNAEILESSQEVTENEEKVAEASEANTEQIVTNKDIESTRSGTTVKAAQKPDASSNNSAVSSLVLDSDKGDRKEIEKRDHGKTVIFKSLSEENYDTDDKEENRKEKKVKIKSQKNLSKVKDCIMDLNPLKEKSEKGRKKPYFPYSYFCVSDNRFNKRNKNSRTYSEASSGEGSSSGYSTNPLEIKKSSKKLDKSQDLSFSRHTSSRRNSNTRVSVEATSEEGSSSDYVKGDKITPVSKKGGSRTSTPTDKDRTNKIRNNTPVSRPVSSSKGSRRLTSTSTLVGNVSGMESSSGESSSYQKESSSGGSSDSSVKDYIYQISKFLDRVKRQPEERQQQMWKLLTNLLKESDQNVSSVPQSTSSQNLFQQNFLKQQVKMNNHDLLLEMMPHSVQLQQCQVLRSPILDPEIDSDLSAAAGYLPCCVDHSNFKHNNGTQCRSLNQVKTSKKSAIGDPWSPEQMSAYDPSIVKSKVMPHSQISAPEEESSSFDFNRFAESFVSASEEDANLANGKSIKMLLDI